MRGMPGGGSEGDDGAEEMVEGRDRVNGTRNQTVVRKGLIELN